MAHPGEAPPRSALLHPAVLAVGGVLVLAAIGVAGVMLTGTPPSPVTAAPPAQVGTTSPAPAIAVPQPQTTATAQGSMQAPVPAAVPANPVTDSKPSFDIVRVTPLGEAVIAGRAAPGAAVTVEENGKALGTARADAQGQWVLTPTAPIPPGAGSLTLSARGSDGATVKGDGQVAVVIQPPVAPASLPNSAPAALPSPTAPVVVLTTPNAAPRVLQAPAPPTAGPRLTLDVVDYDARGEIRFAGLAPPGGVVRVYVDNIAAGDAQADAQGRWGLLPGLTVTPGDHMLRIDLLSGSGQVMARQELPFQRALIAATAAPEERVVVQPRQNLWRIARQSYGQGMRYTVIFAANRDQIRDPKLIYPGQVFALPRSIPASSSTSR